MYHLWVPLSIFLIFKLGTVSSHVRFIQRPSMRTAYIAIVYYQNQEMDIGGYNTINCCLTWITYVLELP